ncbi:OLC1v1002939C1 [Oldenlandia corymbosa var. corymbosa]|uniref:OLC1v1002939C1 n=1 Tax=Oldenlandia corymbosa var. corymbosa TaxID=529605 RepID=A0AAV1D9P6_OLDCO|nr:OLC1v1002939C1 [Oldenlandia corymbosa var. corymbosa]
MSQGAASSSSSLPFDDDGLMLDGSESGWVEARTRCDHLGLLSSDLTHIPTPDTACYGCQHPQENWLCLSCKDVLCSRFVNKHMLHHFHQKNHPLALSFSDLSVWCFSCDAYLDAQAILSLRPVYETAYILKFGEAPPFRAVVNLHPGEDGASAAPPAKS